MTRSIVMATMAIAWLAGAAGAQPRPGAPLRSGVPTKAVPCAMDDAELLALGDEPVVCWKTGCMKLDATDGSATMVARPPAPKPWLGPVPTFKADSVCLGAKCKRLGKLLAESIADARKDANSGGGALAATTDLKSVVVDNIAWSVAADAPLTLRPTSRDGEPHIVGAKVAGNLLVVDWTTCAGPCTTMQITSSTGRTLNEGTGGGLLLQLDAKRFVVVGEYAEVQIYDLATGKARGHLALGGEPTTYQAVRLDGTTLGVLYEEMSSGDALRFVRIIAEPGKGAEPHVSGAMTLPRCSS